MKEEFRKIIITNETCVTSFYYEEEKHKWEIRVLEENNILWSTSTNDMEGVELLLIYFFTKQSITAEQMIDTIKMSSYNDRLYGYIKSVKKHDSIMEDSHILSNILHDFVELLKKRGPITIFYKRYKEETRLEFYFENNFFSLKSEEKTLKEFLRFCIDKTISETTIQDISTTKTDYILGNLIIPKKYLEEQERKRINDKITKKNLENYQEFLQSNLGKAVKEMLEQEDASMSLRREN